MITLRKTTQTKFWRKLISTTVGTKILVREVLKFTSIVVKRDSCIETPRRTCTYTEGTLYI